MHLKITMASVVGIIRAAIAVRRAGTIE